MSSLPQDDLAEEEGRYHSHVVHDEGDISETKEAEGLIVFENLYRHYSEESWSLMHCAYHGVWVRFVKSSGCEVIGGTHVKNSKSLFPLLSLSSAPSTQVWQSLLRRL